MSNDDNFEPYWLDENDWLVTICPLPKDEDDPEANLETLNWIGRLFGFATATNTRMLALVGDLEMPAYEILFSFDCTKNHEEFLRLVEADGYADASEFTVPARDEIAEARPIGRVFPSEQAELMKWEFPRLCRGGTRSLTDPGVHPRNSGREPRSTRKGETGWTSMKA